MISKRLSSVFCLMLLTASVPVRCDSGPNADEYENTKRVHKAIESCTIPELDLRQKTVGEAVQLFNRIINEQAKDKKPLKVYINYEGMSDDERKNILGAKPFSDMEVKHNISFLHGIAFLCTYTKFVYHFKADGIELSYSSS